MRSPSIILLLLVIGLQYPLWVGKGGWLKVWEVEQQLATLRDNNKQLERRNAGMDAEVTDLKNGYEAIEERARYELGMLKPDEVYVQVARSGRSK
jgi:cell division protein FtsB